MPSEILTTMAVDDIWTIFAFEPKPEGERRRAVAFRLHVGDLYWDEKTQRQIVHSLRQECKKKGVEIDLISAYSFDNKPTTNGHQRWVGNRDHLTLFEVVYYDQETA